MKRFASKIQTIDKGTHMVKITAMWVHPDFPEASFKKFISVSPKSQLKKRK